MISPDRGQVGEVLEGSNIISLETSGGFKVEAQEWVLDIPDPYPRLSLPRGDRQDLRVAVMGAGMGSCKSTTANLVASWFPSAVLVDERPELNPHLANTYNMALSPDDRRIETVNSQNWFYSDKIERHLSIPRNGVRVVDLPFEGDNNYGRSALQTGRLTVKQYLEYVNHCENGQLVDVTGNNIDIGVSAKSLLAPDVLVFLSMTDDNYIKLVRKSAEVNETEASVPEEYLLTQKAFNEWWISGIEDGYPHTIVMSVGVDCFDYSEEEAKQRQLKQMFMEKLVEHDLGKFFDQWRLS